MKKQLISSIFNELEDPRRDKCKKHLLQDIIMITIAAVICGAETWNQIEEYAIAKQEWLRTFLTLINGIPSHDTFNRLFSSLDPDKFESCFFQWVATIHKQTLGEVIAIDGKTIRGAKQNGKKSAIHMVSAWACENNLVLGQVKVRDKSNEITAIPKLLEILEITDGIITIDAMGCQREIASKIIDNHGNYILAVKDNQKELHESIQADFIFSKQVQQDTTIDYGHGRIETRTCSVITDFKHIKNPEKWKNLRSIVRIESTRVFKNSLKEDQTAVRYYISSVQANAKDFQQTIRSHWAIENKLHWTLDVAFGEDASRKRAGNAAQNFSAINKIALNLLKNNKSRKIGVKGKRLKAGWDDNFLIQVFEF